MSSRAFHCAVSKLVPKLASHCTIFCHVRIVLMRPSSVIPLDGITTYGHDAEPDISTENPGVVSSILTLPIGLVANRDGAKSLNGR